MQVTITGRHFEVTPSIKEHLMQKISKLEKYFPHLVQAHAILSVEKYRHIAELTLMAKNFRIAGKEETEDMYVSIDKIIHTMENRLKRYQDKIKDHKSKESNKKLIPLSEFNL
jgi:putative sigma-54 modulation protein